MKFFDLLRRNNTRTHEEAIAHIASLRRCAVTAKIVSGEITVVVDIPMPNGQIAKTTVTATVASNEVDPIEALKDAIFVAVRTAEKFEASL